YNSIMGNTGGDNRAEFDLRLPHAAWWESPKLGGVNVAVMVAPGQNRSADDSGAPEGEFFDSGPGLCSGSSPHGSGAAGPPCNDGSFGDAYSLAVSGDAGALYWTAAYEIHELVNRSGDNAFEGSKDESAYKAGVQWKSDGTTVNAIYESLMRDRGTEPSKYDERSRDGYYLSGVQKVGGGSQIEAAWAHANKTPGDPAGVTPNNQADMYALGYRKFLSKSFAIYGIYATQVNGDGAHYDLGASGHGIPIVGRDGSTGCDGADGCLATKADGTIKAVTISAFSVGFAYTFSAPFEIKVE
ncbi:MAG TPA: hypothetical protein VL359_17010, partial [bacterium]|nr:hypothetical protein [bacterium]